MFLINLSLKEIVTQIYVKLTKDVHLASSLTALTATMGCETNAEAYVIHVVCFLYAESINLKVNFKTCK